MPSTRTTHFKRYIYLHFCTVLLLAETYCALQYRAYQEGRSVRVYLRDKWNLFDLLQIGCVWLLLVAEVLEVVFPGKFNRAKPSE
jgi:hypothetical protein